MARICVFIKSKRAIATCVVAQVYVNMEGKGTIAVNVPNAIYTCAIVVQWYQLAVYLDTLGG